MTTQFFDESMPTSIKIFLGVFLLLGIFIPLILFFLLMFDGNLTRQNSPESKHTD